MYKEWSYLEVEEKSKELKAIGEDEIYLSIGDIPWDLATGCKAGGTHRLDMDTSVWFYAVSPSGINLRWSFDIEPRSANGKGTYQIDNDGCMKVLASLKEPCKTQFKEYLLNCAYKVEKQAKELLKQYTDELETITILKLMVEKN